MAMTYCLQSFPWHDPRDVLYTLREEPQLTCLYSSMQNTQVSTTSYIAWESLEHVTPKSFADFSTLSAHSKIQPEWFGYIAYEFAQTSTCSHAFMEFERAEFRRYGHVMIFNHAEQRVDYYVCNTSQRAALQPAHIIPHTTHRECEVVSLMSAFTKQDYLACVMRTLAHIACGNFYQANITRKFFGTFNTKPCPVLTFLRLCTLSPAPYSALLRDHSKAILSSSPEHFLSIHASGKMCANPIKGSAPRGCSPKEDAAIAKALQDSEKNNAENRMITDLMRNDFSRVSIPGSVCASESAQLHTYRTIHHLISTIEGQKVTGKHLGDVLEATFPPGSMTGAPKQAAIHWCKKEEPMVRGPYSGILGWIGAHDGCDFSVIIRTLLMHGKHFEFQVGGGIVADSTPELEWEETLIKARGIAECLGISEDDLRNL